MPGIITLINSINYDVNTSLINSGYPALTDGYIALVGRQHIFEQSSPNRIVWIPISSKFGPKSVYNRSNVSGFPSNEILSQNQQRSIASEIITLEIHCWGQDIPPNPDTDFDITQAIYQQIIMSTHLLTAGSYTLLDGKWIDQVANASQLYKAGHEFVFGLQIATPILDKLLEYAPIDVSASTSTAMIIGSSLELGCVTS